MRSVDNVCRTVYCLSAFSEPTKRRPLRLLSNNKQTSLFSFAHPDKIYPDKEVKYGAVSYIVPKNCIVIYPPHTDERKAAARERAKITGFQPRNDR